VVRAENENGALIFSHQAATDVSLDPVTTSLLVGMMKQTLEIGTGMSARAWGVRGGYAGKTGTTSDTKDAWFAGFDGRLLTVVWVGYDDNTAMGLTGAGAALPIWSEITKRLQSLYKPTDFNWPTGIEVREMGKEDILKKFPGLKHLPERLYLNFRNWAS
jgi:penicillin-binding protein 1B